MVVGLAVRDGIVYAGGDFTAAGTNASSRFGIFRGLPSGPMLAVGVMSATLSITWPSSDTGYQLESTTSLPDNWQPVTSGITDNGATKIYVAPIEAGVTGRFYRLETR
jgi:hypothetical protein